MNDAREFAYHDPANLAVKIKELYKFLHTYDANSAYDEKSNVHPMEAILREANKKDVTNGLIRYAVHFDMKVSLTDNILDHLIYCAPIMTRGQLTKLPLEILATMSMKEITTYLYQLTDVEIFKSLEVIVPYYNRASFITGCASSLKSKMFMVPKYTIRAGVIDRQERNLLSRSINKTSEYYVICFGTALQYYSYQFQELAAAVRDDFGMNHPENPAIQFTPFEIATLAPVLMDWNQPARGFINTRLQQAVKRSHRHSVFVMLRHAGLLAGGYLDEIYSRETTAMYYK